MFNTILGLVGLLCAIWIIYDVFTNQNKMSAMTKVLWVILALVFSIIAAIAYYAIYKRNA